MDNATIVGLAALSVVILAAAIHFTREARRIAGITKDYVPARKPRAKQASRKKATRKPETETEK
jgi:hypothetical protein